MDYQSRNYIHFLTRNFPLPCVCGWLTGSSLRAPFLLRSAFSFFSVFSPRFKGQTQTTLLIFRRVTPVHIILYKYLTSYTFDQRCVSTQNLSDGTCVWTLMDRLSARSLLSAHSLCVNRQARLVINTNFTFNANLTLLLVPS